MGEGGRHTGVGRCGQAVEWAGAAGRAGEKKRREEGREGKGCWAASGPAREGGQKKDWARTWGWARMEER